MVQSLNSPEIIETRFMELCLEVSAKLLFNKEIKKMFEPSP